MSTTTKGDPLVTAGRRVDRRKVELSLANCSRAADVFGRMFMPDTLRLEWMNGRLTCCDLSGRVLRADGALWLDERRGHVNYFLPQQEGLSDTTPEWVSELISKHQP